MSPEAGGLLAALQDLSSVGQAHGVSWAKTPFVSKPYVLDLIFQAPVLKVGALNVGYKIVALQEEAPDFYSSNNFESLHWE